MLALGLKQRQGQKRIGLANCAVSVGEANSSRSSSNSFRDPSGYLPNYWQIVSDQRACRKRLREYRVRMDVEQSFRDDKSGGFNMDDTHLMHAERLERLLLALAIAKLWCHELGEQVLAGGEDTRRVIDPGSQRELSLFQLGLRWFQRCVSTNFNLLPNFQAHLSPLFLSPVVHSGSQ